MLVSNVKKKKEKKKKTNMCKNRRVIHHEGENKLKNKPRMCSFFSYTTDCGTPSKQDKKNQNELLHQSDTTQDMKLDSLSIAIQKMNR